MEVKRLTLVAYGNLQTYNIEKKTQETYLYFLKITTPIKNNAHTNKQINFTKNSQDINLYTY